MFEKNDEEYLLRVLGLNNVVLFLGAGFSHDAKNQLGDNIPTGNKLAKMMWEFRGYKEDYDGTNLSEIYEALLRKGKPEIEIKNFLEQNLLCSEIPDQYDVLTSVYWYRIYTTNVDNLVKEVFNRTKRIKLDINSYPNDYVSERDQILDSIQLIHLHGLLPCRPSDLTFSITQYAKRATPHDPLYQLFVNDYSYKPTIFVGTELNEPLFWQYIEARKAKNKDHGEHRGKSFLISPKISPTKIDILKSSFNIIPVQAKTEEFLNWLSSKLSDLPSRTEIIKAKMPGFIEMLQADKSDGKYIEELKKFGEVFHHVQTEVTKRHNDRSYYLLGASPRWEDIISNKDAPRNITSKIQADIESFFNEETKIRVIAILGSAGCGKSTILRRLGMNLTNTGRAVYLTNSEELPKVEVIARALEALDRKVILLFDNSEIVLGILPRLIKELATITNPPILIIASRINDFQRLNAKLKGHKIIQHYVSNLERNEIDAVLHVLEKNKLLGRLSGLSHSNRVKEFEDRANKQILVAMREATSGRGFDDILNDEFSTLVPQETKILYLCVALATECGFRITKQEFIGCADVNPSEALQLLELNLRDIVIQTGVDNNLLLLRHRAIAEYMVNQSVPRLLLKEAYIRILGVLSTEIKGKAKRSRVFNLYRTLVNHHTIYKRFEENTAEARSIYDSLSDLFKNDAQFLLQYGSLELESGNLQFAENYINQADTLLPDNYYIENAKGLLFLKKAIVANTKSEAIAFRDKGSEMLENVMNNPDIDDAYSVHIYCGQRLDWSERWTDKGSEEYKQELENLRNIIATARRLYPNDPRIREINEVIDRKYLSLSI